MITFCHKIAFRIILLVFSVFFFYLVITVFFFENSYFTMNFIIRILGLIKLFIKAFSSVQIGDLYSILFFTKSDICLTAPTASQGTAKVTCGVVESSETELTDFNINPVIYIISVTKIDGIISVNLASINESLKV